MDSFIHLLPLKIYLTDITATHLRPWLLSFLCFPPFDKRIADYSEERTSAEGAMKHSRPRSRLRPRDALLPASLISNSLPERIKQLLQNHASGDRKNTSLRNLPSSQVHLVLPCMLLSSPDPLNSSFMVTDTIDIDMTEKDNCAVGDEYTRDTFCYLREAEVG